MSAVKLLDFSNNEIADVPYELGYIEPLSRLALEGNPIRTIRRTLLSQSTEELKKYLRTRGDPPSWSTDHRSSDTKPVQMMAERTRDVTGGTLDLSGLNLDSLPDNLIEQLRRSHSFDSDELSCRVTEVLLAKNCFRTVPLELSSFNQLRVLDLSENKLNLSSAGELSEMRFPRVQVLNISKNGLTVSQLEAIIHALEQSDCALSSLLADHNSLERMPRNLSSLIALRELNISSNKIRSVERSLERMAKLEVRRYYHMLLCSIFLLMKLLPLDT